MDDTLTDLASIATDTTILLTAAAGSDVSGESDDNTPIDGLSMRHRSYLLENGYEPLWIERHDMGRRRLYTEGSTHWLTLVDEGLEFSDEE